MKLTFYMKSLAAAASTSAAFGRGQYGTTLTKIKRKENIFQEEAELTHSTAQAIDSPVLKPLWNDRFGRCTQP